MFPDAATKNISNITHLTGIRLASDCSHERRVTYLARTVQVLVAAVL